jgi:hypothetical protein
MNEPLARFLITLAGDVHRLDQFNRGEQDRETLVRSTGLPIGDQDALLSGDADRIYDALQGPDDDAAILAHAVKHPPVKTPAVKKPGVKKPAVKKPGVKKR